MADGDLEAQRTPQPLSSFLDTLRASPHHTSWRKGRVVRTGELFSYTHESTSRHILTALRVSDALFLIASSPAAFPLPPPPLHAVVAAGPAPAGAGSPPLTPTAPLAPPQVDWKLVEAVLWRTERAAPRAPAPGSATPPPPKGSATFQLALLRYCENCDARLGRYTCLPLLRSPQLAPMPGSPLAPLPPPLPAGTPTASTPLLRASPGVGSPAAGSSSSGNCLSGSVLFQPPLASPLAHVGRGGVALSSSSLSLPPPPSSAAAPALPLEAPLPGAASPPLAVQEGGLSTGTERPSPTAGALVTAAAKAAASAASSAIDTVAGMWSALVDEAIESSGGMPPLPTTAATAAASSSSSSSPAQTGQATASPATAAAPPLPGLPPVLTGAHLQLRQVLLTVHQTVITVPQAGAADIRRLTLALPAVAEDGSRAVWCPRNPPPPEAVNLAALTSASSNARACGMSSEVAAAAAQTDDGSSSGRRSSPRGSSLPLRLHMRVLTSLSDGLGSPSQMETAVSPTGTFSTFPTQQSQLQHLQPVAAAVVPAPPRRPAALPPLSTFLPMPPGQAAGGAATAAPMARSSVPPLRLAAAAAVVAAATPSTASSPSSASSSTTARGGEVCVLTSRLPEWDATRRTLKLKFLGRGRVAAASSKNFLIEAPLPPPSAAGAAGGAGGATGTPSRRHTTGVPCLQFGKCNPASHGDNGGRGTAAEGVWCLDHRAPLAPLQAFAALLTASAWAVK